MFVNDVSRGSTGRPQFNEQFDKTQMIKGDVSLPFYSPTNRSLIVQGTTKNTLHSTQVTLHVQEINAHYGSSRGLTKQTLGTQADFDETDDIQAVKGAPLM